MDHPSAHVLDRGMLVDGGDGGVFGSVYSIMEIAFNVGLLASPVVALIYVAVNVVFSGDATGREGTSTPQQSEKSRFKQNLGLDHSAQLPRQEKSSSDWLRSDEDEESL